MEIVSLEEIPVIDAHCFLYKESSLTREGLDRLFSLGGPTVGSICQTAPPQLVRHYAENTVAFRSFIRELSRFLSCPASTEEVLRVRSTRANDFKAYAEALMRDAGIQVLLVDNGARELSEVDEFGQRFPGTVKKTFRLETLIGSLLEVSESFKSLVTSFDEALENAVWTEGCVAFKSIIAYRTGLDIQRVSEAEAEEDFKVRAERMMWFGPHVKKLRDFLLRRALIKSVSLKVPVLIHTGLGDTDVVASECNPVLLADLLRDKEVVPAKVVLVHGGFPYTYEAGWLANVLPNVFFELSACLPPFVEPAVSARRYGDVLQWVPLPKLIYGSDSSEIPETTWYYALLAKRAMAQALSELVETRVLTEREALEAAENIFFNNAKALFRL